MHVALLCARHKVKVFGWAAAQQERRGGAALQSINRAWSASSAAHLHKRVEGLVDHGHQDAVHNEARAVLHEAGAGGS